MVTWFGHDGEALARVLDLPRVAALTQVGSTMDEAHAMAAEGTPAGTLVLAEEQLAGRGRGGKSWRSGSAEGIWMTLVERPRATTGIEVLSLRIGIALAPVLERWATGHIRLKWPNDLFVGEAKLAGVLVEARWKGPRLDWVAIGVGINLSTDDPARAALDRADPRVVLEETLPALRAAAFASGPLHRDELDAFARRDLAAGRTLTLPARGTARGISATGELLVETEQGLTSCRAGSLVLAHH